MDTVGGHHNTNHYILWAHAVSVCKLPAAKGKLDAGVRREVLAEKIRIDFRVGGKWYVLPRRFPRCVLSFVTFYHDLSKS